MKKIYFTFFLAVAANALAQTVTTVGDIRYLIEDDHAVVARQDKELTGPVTIPAEIEYGGQSYAVTEMVKPTNLEGVAGGTVGIEGGAFQECQITAVTLPNSITTISAGAFCDCQLLASVNLPGSLTQIGPAAFANCTSLERIEIPSSVTDLGGNTDYGYLSYVFGGCTSLSWVDIPAGVTELGDGLLMNTAMTVFEIPVGITRIGEHALACPALTSVTCGVRDARTIDCDVTAFGDMTKIALQVPQSGKAVYEAFYPWCDFQSISGYADEGETLVPEQRHVTIDGVRYLLYEKIEEGANAREASASVDIQPTTLSGDIIIPAQVTYDGNDYPVIAILPTYWYYGSHMDDDFYSYRGAFTDTQVTSVTLPASIATIGAFAFYRAESLQRVDLSQLAGLESAGRCAFSHCTALTQVAMPEGLKELADGSFAGCTSLKQLVVPEGVTTIGGECFIGSGIETLTIPSTCTSIGYQALELPALKTLHLNVEDMTTLDCTATAFGHDTEQEAAQERLARADLIVPLGAAQVYGEYYPWLNFRSVSDVNCPYLELDGTILSAPADAFTVSFPEGMTDEEKFETHGNGDYVQGLNLKEGVTVTFTTDVDASWVYVYLFNGNQNTVKLDGTELTEIGDNGQTDYRRYDRLVEAGTHTITCNTYEGNQWPCMFLVEAEDATATYRFEPAELTVRIGGVRYVLNKDNASATVARQNKDLSGDIVVPDKVTYDNVEYTVNAMVAPTFVMAAADGDYRTTDGAFQDCQISSVSLPATLTTIAEGAFNNCQQLKQVTLADGIQQLSAACFANCTSLEEIYLPETITDLGSETEFGYWSYVFGGCTSLKKVNTPKLVTQLGQGCFKDSGIETFLIPANITTLAPYCFASNSLKNIKICHTQLTAESINYTESNFEDVSGIELIVPEGKTSLYQEFYPWKEFGTITEYIDQGDEHQYNAYGIAYESDAETPAAARRRNVYKATAEATTAQAAVYMPSGVPLSLSERVAIGGTTYVVEAEDVPATMPASNIVLKATLTQVGDANKDGVVNVADITWVIAHLTAGAPATFFEKAADVDGKNSVDATDIVGIVNLILKE